MKFSKTSLVAVASATVLGLAVVANAVPSTTFTITDGANTTGPVTGTTTAAGGSFYSNPNLFGLLDLSIVTSALTTTGNPTNLSETVDISNISDVQQTFSIDILTIGVGTPPPGEAAVQDAVGGPFESDNAPTYSTNDSISQIAIVNQGGGNTTTTAAIGNNGGPTPFNVGNGATSPAATFVLAGGYSLSLNQTIVLGKGDSAITSAGVSISSEVPEPTTIGLLAVGAMGLLAKRRKTA